MLVLRGVHSEVAFLELRDMFFLVPPNLVTPKSLQTKTISLKSGRGPQSLKNSDE